MRLPSVLGVVLLAGLAAGTAARAEPPASSDDGVDPTIEMPPPPVPVKRLPAGKPEGRDSGVRTAAAGFATPETGLAPLPLSKPGVLTREGTLVVEPSIEYQHTSVNTFVAGGVAILDTVLIGNVQATQANRDSVTGTMAFRYGISDRLEGEFRAPYVYRHDSTTNTLVNAKNSQETTNLTDSGLGDLEAAVHYQVNDGNADWPIFVTNLRVKSDAGTGPFDVKRDVFGVPQELATGSGLWGIEPSVTLIAPSDPAVFFFNAGYLYNVPSDLDHPYNATLRFKHVDPGGAVRLGMGMGIALNEKVSMSVGYQHDFISDTRITFSDNSTAKSPSLSVGTLNLGVNWQRDEKTALNVNLGIGVTRDAPDIRMTVRVPISFQLY